MEIKTNLLKDQNCSQSANYPDQQAEAKLLHSSFWNAATTGVKHCGYVSARYAKSEVKHNRIWLWCPLSVHRHWKARGSSLSSMALLFDVTQHIL